MRMCLLRALASAFCAARAHIQRFVSDSQVDVGSFDAIFYPGGHGPLWDLVENAVSIKLIENFWASGKPVGAVCHG